MSARSKPESVPFPRFEIQRVKVLRGKGIGWYWRLVARNGETLCVAESFRDPAAARRSIRSMVRVIDDMQGGDCYVGELPIVVIR